MEDIQPSFRSSFQRYFSRKKRSQYLLKTAKSLSVQECIDAIEEFISQPSRKKLFKLIKIITSSGIWVGHSLLFYLRSFIDFETSRYNELNDPKTKKIISSITNQDLSLEKKITKQEIFQALFKEREYAHLHPHLQSLPFPKIKNTIVLIDGVLNEIFTMSTFERTLRNLSRKYGVKYFIPDISGHRGTAFNAKALRIQIEKFSHDNPDEKLWLIGYSKGGVDGLHYIFENSEFAKKNIRGISTIASPILGSNHFFDHKIIKILNSLNNFSEESLASQSPKLIKEVTEYLDSQKQTPWFLNNFKKLPKELFYTSLALESEWYESHVWMILTKIFLLSKHKNDGVVDCSFAQLPDYFSPGINLGIIQGHHLIGTRSSFYSQEALIEAHIFLLKHLNLLD